MMIKTGVTRPGVSPCHICGERSVTVDDAGRALCEKHAREARKEKGSGGGARG